MSEPKIISKAWAAVRDDEVITTISMTVPADVDFEKYRTHALAALETVGQVRTGEIFELNGEIFFLPRQKSHQNRSKKAPKSPPTPIKMKQYYE
ncbi:hypothetical protein [Methylophaga nitratireducenticrescens]|uniref:hypothetical protein n=1 Tax=Methylophaga nitratireducenticrescens TaxID=754476 RepID=UPI00146EF559|nr:hypothetical protein [Methylophaga nitratireducenticrescens]